LFGMGTRPCDITNEGERAPFFLIPAPDISGSNAFAIGPSSSKDGGWTFHPQARLPRDYSTKPQAASFAMRTISLPLLPPV
jgi:hypothetical protein